jgi:hypothetical protein
MGWQRSFKLNQLMQNKCKAFTIKYNKRVHTQEMGEKIINLEKKNSIGLISISI